MALVVSYARAFTKSYGWPIFPKSFLPADDGAISLHNRLMNLRNEVYAHSDSKHHKVIPWRIDSTSLTDIRGAPFLRFTKDECERITELIDAIRNQLSLKIAIMRAEIADN